MEKSQLRFPQALENLLGNKVLVGEALPTIFKRKPFQKANDILLRIIASFFCKRRFSTSPFDNVIAPFCYGVYAGDQKK